MSLNVSAPSSATLRRAGSQTAVCFLCTNVLTVHESTVPTPGVNLESVNSKTLHLSGFVRTLAPETVMFWRVSLNYYQWLENKEYQLYSCSAALLQNHMFNITQ